MMDTAKSYKTAGAFRAAMGLTCRTVSGLRLIRPKSMLSAEIISYKPSSQD
jgi:hypothetical protein